MTLNPQIAQKSSKKSHDVKTKNRKLPVLTFVTVSLRPVPELVLEPADYFQKGHKSRFLFLKSGISFSGQGEIEILFLECSLWR